MDKRRISGLPLLVLGSLIVLLTGCKPGVPVVHVESPEAGLSPMLVGVASVFMKIVNTGGGDDVLHSARADIPGTITELHDVQDGKMAKVESIPIPRKNTVELRPAKLHIMVFKMPADVKEGYEFNLILHFQKSGEKNIHLKLRNSAPHGAH